jgi:hypothetical protein
VKGPGPKALLNGPDAKKLNIKRKFPKFDFPVPLGPMKMFIDLTSNSASRKFLKFLIRMFLIIRPLSPFLIQPTVHKFRRPDCLDRIIENSWAV